MSLQSRKIALVGGGQIGIALALMITQKDHAEVVIVDLPGMVDQIKGKALDIMALRPHAGVDVEITATSDYTEIADAEVVIITAGVPRKAGMSRNDLLEIKLHSGKTVLVPFVEAIVPEVQLEEGWLLLTPPPGLLEL